MKINTIKIDTKKKTNIISPLLYGVFFEDINYGGDGGLYAELIANRSFEYYDRDGKVDKCKLCWETIGNAEFNIKSDRPLNAVHTNYAELKGTQNDGICNTGYCKEGFSVKQDEKFNLSFYAMSDSKTELSVRIASKDGTVYGHTKIAVNSNKWIKYEKTITVNGNCTNTFLEIILCETGTVNLEFISLFPNDTFKGRRNGFRRDIAEMIADIKPSFMRFPGGCIVEGRSFDNMYNWKDTIGRVEERKTNYNRWQMEEYRNLGFDASDYFQSYGIGFFEYFQFCEDIGAKPVPVINCGMTCQWHEALLVDTDKLNPYIQDVFDLIEFANGDINSEWGKKRAEMGHREPFNLEYISIGNEQWGKEYFERYKLFQEKIVQKYPDIKLITSAGWKDRGWEFDLAYDWLDKNKDKAYAVDEHFYKEPEWFLDNINRYDNYDRSLPKVFIGEWAAHLGADKNSQIKDRKNNWYAALCEAAFLTGVERNADHVIMTCYAPLLAKINHNQWQPNLIWFDNNNVYGTPSYYIQKMFSEHTGDTAVKTQCIDSDLKISASTVGNKLFVKVVNVSDTDKIIRIETDCNTKCVHIIEMYAEPDDENSLSDPTNIVPKKCEALCEEYTLRKFSVSIFLLLSAFPF
ncbi:MAG: carbohydrate binding domain-containing protein [Muribaculaceae bacterium]|nr:carbohydrate binding domain-containing protein [Roseburia sp.]MCM1432218.1 carbohydrate binding domain-containing protein [Muribaculaceae bacterium]MCM1491695.1 carbohydrate binding domain-containing protein [Muribaculaceae bacterium]